MTDSVQKTLASLRLTVCCLGSALRGEQPGLMGLLQQTQTSLLASRSAADEELEYELAAEIDDLRLHVHICSQLLELRTMLAQPQVEQAERRPPASTVVM